MSEKTNDSRATSIEKGRGKPLDLGGKDANVIFRSVWHKLEEEFGLERMSFPKEVIWLNGAPGAGKGTQTRFIIDFRGLTAEPVVVSSLLKSPEARRLIDAGLMVGDLEVTELVFRALIDPRNRNGVLVDGYPRTQVQGECLKLLYEKLLGLRRECVGTPLEAQFRKPVFHIVVLFVDEEESIKRQMLRGEIAARQNREMEASGVGKREEVRLTDLNREAARKRYQTFQEVTCDSLFSLREVFHYHYINAHGSIEEVQRRIEAEWR